MDNVVYLDYKAKELEPFKIDRSEYGNIRKKRILERKMVKPLS